MKSIVRVGKRVKNRVGGAVGAESAAELPQFDTRVEMIQMLIPLGLKAVEELLQEQVTALAGARYSREGGVPGYARWGQQRGSVYLADQKVAVTVPRVRDTSRGQEVPLSTYSGLRDARQANELALRKVLKGLSCRDYESCVDPVAETFGLSPSSLSRRFKRASAKKLAELSERDLSGYDLISLFLDGKTFGDDQMVIALGVTLQGQKVVLGFVQTANGERAGVYAVPAKPGGARPERQPRRVVCDRRLQGSAAGRGEGVRSQGGRAALSVAQTRKCGSLSAGRPAGGIPKEAAERLPAADL